MLQRFGEALFLGQKHAHDVILLERQLWIRVTHQFRELRHKVGEERLGLAELVAMANCPPDDPSQHVTATFVARDHAVDDEEGAGADVIGDDVERR